MTNTGKVLVIDDDPVMTEIYKVVLAAEGFEVRVVNDAVAGYGALQEFKPDVVLLDLGMPHRNGAEWLATVRKIPAFKALPVVIITAQTEDSPLLKSVMDSEITGVLSKIAWSPEAMVAAVKWVMGNRGEHGKQPPRTEASLKRESRNF